MPSIICIFANLLIEGVVFKDWNRGMDEDGGTNYIQWMPITNGSPANWEDFPTDPNFRMTHVWASFTSKFWDNVPRVNVVRNLMLRPPTEYSLGSRTAHYLLQSLRRLQTVVFAPGRAPYRFNQLCVDEMSYQILMSSIPKSFKRLVLFEHLDKDRLDISKQQRSNYTFTTVEGPRYGSISVSQALAKASLSLEKLSASFIADAKHFFSAHQSTWIWDDLTSLALTSQILVPDSNLYAKINDVLQLAATVAMKMPKLSVMELWNSGIGFPMDTSKAKYINVT